MVHQSMKHLSSGVYTEEIKCTGGTEYPIWEVPTTPQFYKQMESSFWLKVSSYIVCFTHSNCSGLGIISFKNILAYQKSIAI